MTGPIRGALTGALLFHAAVAAADGVSVNPVRVELAAGQKAAALTVTNETDQVRVMQASISAWGPREDALAPAKDALIAPALFRLPPHGKQLVRVGLSNVSADAPAERTYRLFLEEVPEGGAAPNQIRVMLRFSIPLFLAPARVSDALQWSLHRGAGGQAVLALDNRGNRHVRIDAVTVTPASGGTAQQRQMTYVLAGGHHEWAMDLKPLPPGGSRVRVHADSDRGSLDAEPSLTD